MKKFVIVVLCLTFGISGLMAIPLSKSGRQTNLNADQVQIAPKKYPTFQGQVLFVEDPGNPGFGPATKPDPNWDQLLTEIYGAGNYDWFGATSTPTENGPPASTMDQYPLVIWNCYDYWWTATPSLTTTDQNEIASYISNGGSFWLIGQDAHWSGVPDSWFNTYFYSQSITDDYAWDDATLTEQGEAEISGITCTFTSDYQSNGFFSDNVVPAAAAHTVLADQTYPGNHPSILYPGTDYKTTYWTIDGRSPDDWNNWKSMVIGILGVLGAREETQNNVTQFDVTVFPNPANRRVSISYQLPVKSNSFVAIYDEMGRNIQTLVNEVEAAGIHTHTYETEGLANGVYFIRVETKESVLTKQFVVLR